MRDLLIRTLVRPLHEAARRLRPSTRPTTLARDEGLRFRERAHKWSRSRKEEWILERLRLVLREATEAPFYREWFQEAGFDPYSEFGFDDFARLPALDRETVRLNADRMQIPGLPRGQVIQDATGGSTGQPTRVYKGPQERGWREAAGDFFMARIGCPPGSRIALLWGHHLDPVASEAWRDRLRTYIANARWFDCLRISDTRFREYHRELQSWRPDCVVAYASALAPLARAANEVGRPAYPVQSFVSGAEKLMPQDRELVQAVFGRPVHERYGSRDIGLIGFQVGAPRDATFEIDWSNMLVEPSEKATGSMAPVLVTKLHADAMPLIRYRVGDVARFPEDARPGRPTFQLDEVFGREGDRLRHPDGEWFHPVGVPHMMKDLPVREFRLVQAADYSVTVEVVADDAFTSRDRDQIVETLGVNLPGLEIRVEERQEIERTPSGKLRPVVSHVSHSEDA